jgi:hypothetical protein
MTNKKIRPPFILLIISVVIVILGILYQNFILTGIPEQTRIDNVILIAVPFICYFVAILLVYIFFINISGQLLSGRVSEKLYKFLNLILIVGIILGIIMMLQPFTMVLFKISFMIVLISLLLFILWSHVTPVLSPMEEEE